MSTIEIPQGLSNQRLIEYLPAELKKGNDSQFLPVVQIIYRNVETMDTQEIQRQYVLCQFFKRYGQRIFKLLLDRKESNR